VAAEVATATGNAGVSKTDLDTGIGDVHFGLSADTGTRSGASGAANGRMDSFHAHTVAKTFDDSFSCDSIQR